MDRYIFAVGLLGSIMVASLMMFTKKSDDTPEMECWCPAQFTASHIAYTNLVCRNKALYSAVYLPMDSSVPSPYVLRSDKKILSIAKKVGNDDRTIYWVMGEVILSVVLYLFVRGIRLVLIAASQKDEASLHKSRTLVLLYIIVYVLAAMMWAILATGVQWKGKDAPENDSQSNQTWGSFMCDFEIRHLGTVHKYTVQCTYAPKKLDMVACLNQMLCLTLCAMIVFHIVTTFLVFPFLTPISSQKQEPVSCPSLTDGYLVTVLSPADVQSTQESPITNEKSNKA